ncbi:MAG: hypothetical protein QOK28_3426 [Actinomycetota bacterium]|jgi:hypothetical protein
MAPTSDDKPETFSSEQLGAWSLQNDPYTIEGELEGFSRFATGVRTSRKPWLRFAGLVMVTAILGPMVFGLLSLAWRALFG